MYEKTDKRRIYWLIDQLLEKHIDEVTFCDEFYASYDLEIDYSSLTNEEHKYFSELREVVGRFSEFTEDLQEYPGLYYNKDDIRSKALQTKNKLNA